MDEKAARHHADAVFACHARNDLIELRRAAAQYRVAAEGDAMGVLSLLTSDVEALDLEAAGGLGDPDAMRSADALFMRYEQSPDPLLPCVAAFALRAKAVMLANARDTSALAEVAEKAAAFLAEHEDARRQDEIVDHVTEIAFMTIAAGDPFAAITLLTSVADRMVTEDSPGSRTREARALMLQVIAIQSIGETDQLPPILRRLHAGHDETFHVVDALLGRWAQSPGWAGGRVSALANKVVMLQARHQHAAAAEAEVALDAELAAVQATLNPDIPDELRAQMTPAAVIEEVREALLS